MKFLNQRKLLNNHWQQKNIVHLTDSSKNEGNRKNEYIGKLKI